MNLLTATVAPNLPPAEELEAINVILGAARLELVRVANHAAGVILADRTRPLYGIQDNADRLATLQERAAIWEALVDRAVYGTRDGSWTGVTAATVEAAWAYAVTTALQASTRQPQEHGLEAMVRRTRATVALEWLRANRTRIGALPAAVHASIWASL